MSAVETAFPASQGVPAYDIVLSVSDLRTEFSS